MEAKDYIQRYSDLTSSEHYTNNRTLSQDVASLFLPRRSDISEKKSTGTDAGWYDHIYESAPINAAQILAAGQFDLLFSGKWFEARSPFANSTHEQEQAYSIVGERMEKAIAESNFKLEIQEFLADRSTIHTSAVLAEDGPRGLHFTHLPYGCYAIDEDYMKYVDTLFREFKLTARQAAQKFNEPDDVLGEKITKALADPAQASKKFTFIHCIEPRLNRRNSPSKKDKPWKSVYICKEDELVVREGGYDEQPFVCSRFNRWGDSPYGTGPAHVELATARALQKMKQTWLALGDRITSPGIFVGPDQEDDPNPFGITVVSEQSAAMGLPREWKAQGDYNISLDAIDREIRKLEESFFVPLFKLLTSDSERQREKTAYETAKMLEEQVGRASPTFSRLNEEVIEPLLTRVFAIEMRRGTFNDVIEELIAVDADGTPSGIESPKIEFTSKLAQAMKAIEGNAFVQFLNEMGMVFEMFPEAKDNFNIDKWARRSWKNKGLPMDALMSEDEVGEARQQRAQMMQAQAALEAGTQASQIAKNTQGMQL
jgi:hypothetical protein